MAASYEELLAMCAVAAERLIDPDDFDDDDTVTDIAIVSHTVDAVLHKHGIEVVYANSDGRYPQPWQASWWSGLDRNGLWDDTFEAIPTVMTLRKMSSAELAMEALGPPNTRSRVAALLIAERRKDRADA